MRLALFTNMPSHYQVSLAKAFYAKLGGNFALISWQADSQERRDLGWKSTRHFDWLIRAHESKENQHKALDILRSAEIVIWGYAPHNEIVQRVSQGKLTFCYTERLFKQGRWRLVDPRVIRSVQKKRAYEGLSHHLLAVGPYCAEDFRLLGMFKNRMWRWGYFPELPLPNPERRLGQLPEVLWAGRMLPWKQVDLLLAAAKWARDRCDISFQLTLIGHGPEEQNLRTLTNELGLMEIVNFQGPQSPNQILDAMMEADIYVLPSNKSEGWGVVVNEAMSCGCCVIGSTQAGSVPWLISDGVNGFHFNGWSARDLGQKLVYCLTNAAHRQETGLVARSTIESLWSPFSAADRFLRLCDALAAGGNRSFQDNGPCSRA